MQYYLAADNNIQNIANYLANSGEQVKSSQGLL